MLLDMKEAVGFAAPPPQVSNIESPDSLSLGNKVSPSILLIIIIVAIIFFVSGLLHLLIRFLLRAPPSRDTDELESVSGLEGRLQQLFHLHDAGVDRSLIDTLPVFHYKAIIGLKNPFDCAVCLCEFEPQDKLRLLPKCSHAFHMDCIDTWLLSHSTCPLCRSTLLPQNNTCSPIVLVLESASVESSRSEINIEQLGLSQHRSKDEQVYTNVGQEEKVVQVKIGKLRNVDDGQGSSSSTRNVDARRCFSMGSFSYVIDDTCSLQVPIRSSNKLQSSKKKLCFPLEPGHRQAKSECDFFKSERQHKFNWVEATRSSEIQGPKRASSITKRESFSISKIWLRGEHKKPNEIPADPSRRAFSFRFPGKLEGADECSKAKNGGGSSRRTISEIDIGRWDNGGSQEGNFSCNSLDSQTNPPSFGRKTLLWLMGRQNKLVHSSLDDPPV